MKDKFSGTMGQGLMPDNQKEKRTGKYLFFLFIFLVIVVISAWPWIANQGLIWAIKEGKADRVKFLLSKGAEVDAKDINGRTALTWAILEGHREITDILLSEGADTNAKGDDWGWTALMWAATGYQTKIVELLLEHGAHIEDKSTHSGHTALIAAAGNNRTQMVKLLLEKGADIEAKNNEGSTPLIAAASWKCNDRGCNDALKALLKNGADINAKTNDGRTALMYAAEIGYLDTVKILLSQKADLYVEDKHGKTALMWAKEGSHPKIVKLLEQHIAFEKYQNKKKESKLTEARKTGETWRAQITGMEFIWIEGGCYLMGREADVSWGQTDEKPVHEVCLDGFWLGKYEVTNAQYRKYNPTHDSGKSRAKGGGTNSLNHDNQPAARVSWDDAQAFIRWLNSRYGGKYRFRLPTEAEWEYACRAGSTSGSIKSIKKFGEYAWYMSNSNKQSQPVGSKKPNNWGLYDMLGNVLEWCQDTYTKDAYSYHTRINPLNEEKDWNFKILRGGYWGAVPWHAESVTRFHFEQDYRAIFAGFRCVRAE